jgi:hypothetical protein
VNAERPSTSDTTSNLPSASSHLDLDLRTFHVSCCTSHKGPTWNLNNWFLLRDHLMAQVTSAQKAKDRKFLWVEFTPQFHSYLVKCAVMLVSWPLNKVKKVMFVYILELLNGEGPQAFFNLTKGQCLVMKAQKEKKHLAQKRNCVLRWEHQRVAKEAASNKPQWQCLKCRHKFAFHKGQK